MSPIRLIRTATFRTCMLFAVALTAGLAIMLYLIYDVMSSHAREYVRIFVRSHADTLVREAVEDGMAELMRLISTTSELPDAARFDYLLTDPKGIRIAGALTGVEPREGWLERPARVQNNGAKHEPAIELIFGVRLADGSLLQVAKVSRLVPDMQAFLRQLFLWAVVPLFAIAAIGGVTMSKVFVRRINRITAAADAIIEHDLSKRIPASGNGVEFDRLAANLNLMLGHVQSSMERVRKVSDDIAHDLRTPLARLRQGLERTLKCARSVPDYKSAVERAIHETDEVLSIFTALLRISQIEAGAYREQFCSVDLSEVFARVGEAYRAAVEDRGKFVIADIAPGIKVWGDRDMLTQMLSNLVENALRHTPARTTVRLTLTVCKSQPVGMVADDGPGIPEEWRSRAFQRFARLDQSRSTSGWGLGLSLVAAVASLHGITVALQDNRPGLRVALTFPSLAASAASPAVTPEKEAAPTSL